jgi:hypothetical protein
MENKIYKIYHIPTFIHKDGRVGKIGCTELEAQERVLQQGYIDFEILEEHTDIMIASNREIELQKQYGYPVDFVAYYKTRQIATQEGCIKGGKTQGPISGKIQGPKNVESGQLASLRTSEHQKKAGSAGGTKTAQSGKLAEARKISIKKLSKAVLVFKIDGTFIGEYESRNECARQLNIDRRNVGKVCLGKAKQTGGYVIKYKPTST